MSIYKKFVLSFVTAFIIVCCSINSLYAIPLTFDGVTGGLTDTITVALPNYNYSGEVEVGINQYHLVTGGEINSFCIDFYDESTYSTVEYTSEALAVSPMSALNNPNGIGQLAALNIDKLWTLKYNDALNSTYIAAVMQVAIWKAIAESEGGTVTSSGFDTAANLMLDNAEGYTGPLDSIFAYNSNQYQDFVGIPDKINTFGLFGITILALLYLQRICPIKNK